MKAILRIVSALPCLLVFSGCVLEERSRADFERHNSSILRESYQDPGALVFEAKAGASFPPDSESAEALRMQWLQDWLDTRGLCPGGHEILLREPIAAGQPNFHDMDLRYKVRCLDVPAAPPS